jgi:hypothetical protein
MLPDYDAALGGDDTEGIPGMHSWQNADEANDEGIDMPEWSEEPVRPVARRVSGDLSDAVRGTWNFANLPGASGGLARSEADEGMDGGAGDDDDDDDNDSTTAQNDDNSSLADDMADEEGEYAARRGQYPRAVFTGDMEEQPMLRDGPEPGADYVLPDEPHPVMFDAEAPPPYQELDGRSMSGVVTTVTAEQIADEVGHAEHVDQAGAESRVTEIRLEESDDEHYKRSGGAKDKRDTTA